MTVDLLITVSDLVGNQNNECDTASETVDYNDCSMLLMGYAPKRKKSVKMKRYERNREWKVHLSTSFPFLNLS
jgi:hypothetical protein